MLSPSETGTTLGATPGTCKEPGDRPLIRVPGTGGARGASRAGQLAALGAARPGKAPHLIHGGPCLILACRNVSFQDRHAGTAGIPAAMTRVMAGSTGEVPAQPRRDRTQ